jgi:uncharacterized protein (TIGR03086 family)
MSEAADQYRRPADRFQALVDGTAPERWASPSPCTGWQARDVVAHVVDFSAQVVGEKAGVTDAPTFADFDEPAAAFRATRQVIERMLDDPATPPKAATHLVWSLSFDLPQHGWDLAVATGQDATIAPEEVDLLWGSINGAPQQWDWQRANGWYAGPVPVREDAPLQDRVLGLLGRDPRWTPPTS